MTNREDAAALSMRLEAVASGVLRELLPVRSPVAVVDFPYSDNFGDAAIWAGQNALLKTLGHRRRYVVDVGRYSAADLRRAHPTGPILLHGGGNFGDYWPEHQELRERVLADFPDRRIVQLPQTVGFQDSAGQDAVAKAMGVHRDFTLLARDRASVELGQGMGLRTILCPDSATHLGPLARIGAPEFDILVLARTDHESGGLRGYAQGSAPAGAVVEEWGFGRAARLRWEAAKAGPRIDRRLPEGSAARSAFQAPLRVTYDVMATTGVRAAVRQLSRARVLVTDRLHAHVIATLLGIPNVVLDNNYGKVRGIYDAFTYTSSTAGMATDPAAAFARAQVLLGR